MRFGQGLSLPRCQEGSSSVQRFVVQQGLMQAEKLGNARFLLEA